MGGSKVISFFVLFVFAGIIFSSIILIPADGGASSNVSIIKTANVESGESPLDVLYTFEITNNSIRPPGTPVSILKAIDDKCGPITVPILQRGDANRNGLLDPGETFVGSCQQTITETSTNMSWLEIQECFDEECTEGHLFSGDPNCTDGGGFVCDPTLRSNSVTVTIKDPEPVRVPDITGQTEDDAKTLITEAGLKVGTISENTSETIPEGHVVSQDPPSGTEVEKDSKVDFLVSLGPASDECKCHELKIEPERTLEVPNFGTFAEPKIFTQDIDVDGEKRVKIRIEVDWIPSINCIGMKGKCFGEITFEAESAKDAWYSCINNKNENRGCDGRDQAQKIPGTEKIGEKEARNTAGKSTVECKKNCNQKGLQKKDAITTIYELEITGQKGISGVVKFEAIPKSEDCTKTTSATLVVGVSTKAGTKKVTAHEPFFP